MAFATDMQPERAAFAGAPAKLAVTQLRLTNFRSYASGALALSGIELYGRLFVGVD